MPFSAGVRGRAPRSVMAAPAPRSRSIRARLVTVLFQRHSASFVAPWLPPRCRTPARRIHRKNCAARGKTVAASGAGHPREMMRNCVSLGRLVVLPQRKLHPSIFNLQSSASRLVSRPLWCSAGLRLRPRDSAALRNLALWRVCRPVFDSPVDGNRDRDTSRSKRRRTKVWCWVFEVRQGQR